MCIKDRPEGRGLVDGMAIHPSSASPGRDQSQPGGAIPTGLRYQEVPEFVPTGDVPAFSSTTSGLNRKTGSTQCSEDVPPDNFDEGDITRASGVSLAVLPQKRPPARDGVVTRCASRLS